jgi:hypothetical protein
MHKGETAMSVNVSWYDDEHTIILQEFPLTWTWDEFFDAVKSTVELEKTVDHPVYVMGTNPPSGKMPSGNVLAQFNAAIKMHEPNMQLYIMATNNSFTALMGRVFVQTTSMRDKVRMVATLDDGLRLIAEDKIKIMA